MTTIIPAFASTVSSAGSLLQPKADGEGANFAELLESVETGAGQQAQAGNESADKQEVAGSEQGETTPKEADIKVKAEPEEEADKPAGATAEQKHDKPEEELRADTLQSGNLVPAAAMSAAESGKRDSAIADKAELQQPAPAKDNAPVKRDNAQRVDTQVTPYAEQERAVAASANGESKPAAQPNVATEVKPQQPAPVTDSAPAKDNAPVKRDNAQRVDTQVTPYAEQERAVAASANGESKPAAQPNVAAKEPVVKAETVELKSTSEHEAGVNKAGASVSTNATPAPQLVQQSSAQSGQPSVQQSVTPSSFVPAPEPELDSSTNTAFRQDTVQPQQAATPNWLAQIEHGRRWSQQGSTESKADTTVAEQNTESLSSPITEKASADAGTDGESRDEDASRGEKLADALAGAVQSGAHQAEKNEIQPLQQTAAITVTREAAAPERAAQPQLERALNLHQAAPEQNARQLSQQVQVMVNQELQEADIRLNPSELGGIRIQLKFEQGEVSMQIQAQHAQARDMLEQAMPRLRDMLQQQGIQLGQGQVGSFAGQQQNTAQNGNQGQGATGRENGHNSSSFEQGPNDDEAGFTQYSAGRTLHEGGIDFFA